MMILVVVHCRSSSFLHLGQVEEHFHSALRMLEELLRSPDIVANKQLRQESIAFHIRHMLVGHIDKTCSSSLLACDRNSVLPLTTLHVSLAEPHFSTLSLLMFLRASVSACLCSHTALESVALGG